MHNILIAYATHEGHTAVVAEHLANTLEGQGWAALDRYAGELINEAPTGAPRS